MGPGTPRCLVTRWLQVLGAWETHGESLSLTRAVQPTASRLFSEPSSPAGPGGSLEGRAEIGEGQPLLTQRRLRSGGLSGGEPGAGGTTFHFPEPSEGAGHLDPVELPSCLRVVPGQATPLGLSFPRRKWGCACSQPGDCCLAPTPALPGPGRGRGRLRRQWGDRKRDLPATSSRGGASRLPGGRRASGSGGAGGEGRGKPGAAPPTRPPGARPGRGPEGRRPRAPSRGRGALRRGSAEGDCPAQARAPPEPRSAVPESMSR